MPSEKKHLWKPGQSGNPKGRPPLLIPEIQREIDQNKSAMKQLILRYFSMTDEQILQRLDAPDCQSIEGMLASCITTTKLQGDVDKFRKLLEIVFGKLPEDRPEFETTQEEKDLVIEYRRRLQGSSKAD